MPTWGVKYQCTFDPVGPVAGSAVYGLNISQKNYTDDPIWVIGSTVPILHQWQTDDPKAPIRGSSLSISLINENGSLPLSSFYSVDDDEFKVQFYYLTSLTLLFEGFLVQDDCSETMVDFTHEINLSATDNLGLLKDVALDKAKIVYDVIGTATDTWSTTVPHTVTLPAALAAIVHPGDIIFITSLILTYTYHVTEATGADDVIVSETVATGTTGLSDDIEIQHPRPFDDKVTLAFIINNCLWATGLTLNTYVWGRIIEAAQNETTSFLDQTLIDPNSFRKSDIEFDDCYTVLEKILSRFKMTLFQAKGVWQIMRWDELRYYSNAMLAYVYDSDFVEIDEASMDNVFTAGIDELTVAEAGLLQKILRPLIFDKETFNYKQPKDLLRNANLQQLGELINTSTTGSGDTLQTSREYEAPWWFYTDAFPTASGVNGAAEFFIRVITDHLENEIDRYLVTKNNDIHSYQIEANAGDTFTFSFSFRTPTDNLSGAVLVLIAKLTDGIDTRFACEFGDVAAIEPGWKAGIGFNVGIGGETDSGFVGVSMTVNRIPFDGFLTLYLRSYTSTASDETQYKDISIEYNFNINESTKIIGHTHKDSQVGTIRQTEDEEIFVDSSPRNSIAGTLFLDSMVGLLQEKTARWGHPYLTQDELLGNIITFEQMFWRRIPRTILEGTFYGLTNAPNIVSPLAVFNYTAFPGLNFVPGTMEIDYRNNKFSGTLWEIWEDSEEDDDFSSTYEFKYLYSTT